MTDNPQISNNLREDEVRLIDMLEFLILNKNLILLMVSLFTLSSFTYCFLVTPLYKAKISFLPSQELHILDPFVKKKLSQIRQPIFKQFIEQMNSPDLQKKVATEGNFLQKFKDEPNDSSDTSELIYRINNSITTSPVNWKNDLNRMNGTTVEMIGKDPKVISEFLIALSKAGIKMAQNKTFKIIQESITNKHKLNKLDKQFNIKIIEQEIKILRKQAKAIRLRKINILEDHLKANGNFKAIKEALKPLSPFDDFAFLNSKKNFQDHINVLKKRTNDDLFNPDIIKLQELLTAYKTNQINHPPSEKIRYKLPLKKLISFSEDTKAYYKKRPEVVIIQRKNLFPQEPSTPEKTKIIIGAILTGIFLGVFTAILRSGLRILKQKKALGSP
jgi:LPS O-antigen subunit length determinant protein (WzzB/FepE family)